VKAPIALIALIAFAACGGEARAADLCLSLPQARAAYPGKYLMYHLDGGRKCWDAQSTTRRTVRHRGLPANTPPMPVPRQTVLWPALSLAAIPVDAALLTPEPATAWPLLLDVDEITGGPVAECCWPPLEPPFVERWAALTLPRVPIITGGMK
jgi:hypothetical protein